MAELGGSQGMIEVGYVGGCGGGHGSGWEVGVQVGIELDVEKGVKVGMELEVGMAFNFISLLPKIVQNTRFF